MAGVDLRVEQRGALAMTPALRQAIGFLTLSNIDLSARLADLVGTTAELVQADAAEPGTWLTLMRQVSPPSNREGRHQPAQTPGFGGIETDRIGDTDPGLIGHITGQLPLLVRDKTDLPVAEAFLMVLEPSGWLGADLAEVADMAGVPLAHAARVLQQLQKAEPTGLFARSLAECLRLQAEDQGLLTPAFEALLENLPLLAANDIDALADACGCSAQTVTEMAQALRRMNPKPGASFSQAAAPAQAPDLIVLRDGDGWVVELNARTAPLMKLSNNEAARQAQREARALMQALERRHATVLAIAAEIILHQDGYLRGTAPLAALTINDLARETGMHRSTVSRVTATLFVKTPRRTVRLRELLCAAAPPARRLEDPVSVQAVLERMRAIVAAEDKARPLSDAALAALLLPAGAALARRTVAKYRGMAGIPARSLRREA